MVAATETRPSDGKVLAAKARTLLRQPPTYEVIKELLHAMLAEVRLPFPNFTTLFSLFPQVQQLERQMQVEVFQQILRTAQNVTNGNYTHEFDERLPEQAKEIRALADTVAKELTEKADEIKRAAQQAETFDIVTGMPQDAPMNTPSREEIDAKLEAMEARMDGRVAAIQASIDGFMGRMEERFARADDRAARMEETVRDTQASVGTLKTTIITTAIATVLAIVLGVAAFNATVLSNMVASFESGKNTAAAQAEVKRQTEETAVLLKQLQQQLDAAKQSAPAAQK